MDQAVRVTTSTSGLVCTWDESLALVAPNLRYWQVVSDACLVVSQWPRRLSRGPDPLSFLSRWDHMENLALEPSKVCGNIQGGTLLWEPYEEGASR